MDWLEENGVWTSGEYVIYPTQDTRGNDTFVLKISGVAAEVKPTLEEAQQFAEDYNDSL